MGFQKLLERLGFVRLRDYGLLLTPDGRVVTTRRILDDGFGSVVVGYPNGDLAALELAPQPIAPKIAAPAPNKVATPPAPAPMIAAPTPLAVAATPIIAAPIISAAPAPIIPATPAPIAAVAPAPMPVLFSTSSPPAPILVTEPEEDDWEWEIAVARARAVEEPVARAQPHEHPRQSFGTAAAIEAVTSPWSQNEETATAIRQVRAHANPLPRTIIPVPSLPVANDPQEVTRQMPTPVRRVARGTGSIRG